MNALLKTFWLGTPVFHKMKQMQLITAISLIGVRILHANIVKLAMDYFLGDAFPLEALSEILKYKIRIAQKLSILVIIKFNVLTSQVIRL